MKLDEHLAEDRLKASNQAIRLLQKDNANKIEVAHQIALAIKTDTSVTLSESMQYRLYNEALRYTSAYTRQLESYSIMKDFNSAITTILKRKCSD